MRLIDTHFRTWRLLTWSGLVVIILLFIPFIAIGFLPPPSPTETALQIAERFRSQPGAIRLACVVMMTGFAFNFLYITAIAGVLRRMEGGIPVITYASIAFAGWSTVFFELIPMTWGVSAFRPYTDPAILQYMNDWVWFIFFFTSPGFGLWFVLVGVAILRDHNVPSLYPRWVAYVNFLGALEAGVATCMIFFKTGPFAWNGLMCFWVPMTWYAMWFVTMTATTLNAINRVQREAMSEPALSEIAPARATAENVSV